MSSFISLPATRRDSSPSAASSSSSSEGLYIPVHRRSPSASSSSAKSQSSPPNSPSPLSTAFAETLAASAKSRIYTPSTLLLLSHSPLARLSSDARAALRAAAPEITTNRRQRKARAFHASHTEAIAAAAPHEPIATTPHPHTNTHTNPTAPAQPATPSNPITSRTPHRRPAGRVPTQRRSAALSKVIDEVNWRGRPRHASITLPMLVPSLSGFA